MISSQLIRHSVPTTLLKETREFLYQRGLEGCEGMALWIGEQGNESVHLTRLLIPEQVCTKSAFGVAVDMTERAHLTLLDHLALHERLYVRVHSHPAHAYHSARDDANLVLTHQGALSIVVPDFAREPMRLETCAIYQLDHVAGWRPVPASDLPFHFVVTP